MANKFQITITAVDRMTNVVNKINARMEKMVGRITAPARRMQRSMTNLTQAVARNPIAKFMKRIGTASRFVYRGLTSVLNPFMALIGAGSIAGITNLANSWGRLAYNVQNASRNMGQSTQVLQNFQSAAALAHIDPDAATAELGGLSQHIFDALRHGDADTVGLLASLQRTVKRTPTGEIDSFDYIRQLADKYQSEPRFKNYNLRNAVNNALGLHELAPFLNNGSKGIDALMAQAQYLRPAQTKKELSEGKDLYDAMSRLSESLKSLKDSIETTFAPWVTKAANRITKWAVKERIKSDSGAIAEDADEYYANNNPIGVTNWKGTHGVASFKTPAAGIHAAAERLRYMLEHGDNTIKKIMWKWDDAKGPEDQKNVDFDANVVSKYSELDADAPLTENEDTVNRLIKAIHINRTGDDELGADDIKAQTKQAFSEPVEVIIKVNQQGKVVGTSASRGGKPVKIGHAMNEQH